MNPIQKLPPFKRFCITIGALPSSYIDSMSYYETLVWLINYLQQTVIPAVNNNAGAVEELQTLFTQLQNYVDNYFDNLDVQTEINNKLDDMAESGTLESIVSEYLNSIAIFGYDTVSDMKSATNLINGSYARTMGYYSVNDGGAGVYKIRTVTNEDVEDNGAIIPLDDITLVAELIFVDTINVKQYGAKGDDTTDDTARIKSALSFALANKLKLYFPKGSYIVNETLAITENAFEIYGENKTDSIIHFTNDNDTLFDLQTFATNIHDIQLLGDWSMTQYAIKNDDDNNRSARNIFENIQIKNFKYGIYLTNYSDGNIIRNVYFHLVGNCIIVKQNDNGIIENCVAEPFVYNFCELYQPNACAIRNCLVNTSSDIFDSVENSSAFILHGTYIAGDDKRYGSCVTIENIHSEYIHQFALIGLSDVSLKDIFIMNGNKQNKLNMFHFSNISAFPTKNIEMEHIVFDKCEQYSGTYGLYKAGADETSVSVAGRTYTVVPQRFENVNVNGFNSTVYVASELLSGIYPLYKVKNGNVELNNGRLVLYNKGVLIPDMTKFANIYMFGRSIDNTTQYVCRDTIFKYDLITTSWTPLTRFQTRTQGTNVRYTPATKNGIVLLSVTSDDPTRYGNCIATIMNGVVVHVDSLGTSAITFSIHDDYNDSVKCAFSSYTQYVYIAENTINNVKFI